MFHLSGYHFALVLFYLINSEQATFSYHEIASACACLVMGYFVEVKLLASLLKAYVIGNCTHMLKKTEYVEIVLKRREQARAVAKVKAETRNIIEAPGRTTDWLPRDQC